MAISGVCAAPVHAEPGAAAHPGRCPALYALGVQGTGQSSPDASPTTDSGMLANVFAPMLAAEPNRIERAYVPYDAGFGGAVPGGNVSYMQSVLGGLERLRTMAESVADRCPGTRLAMTGYSQGAHIVSLFARDIGSGRSSIPADRVAAVALLGDPTRIPGAPLFPGAPGQHTPDPPPGTIADGLADLIGAPATVSGGGIGPVRDLADDFGSLTGRVASLCVPGDLACDAPTTAPILHMLVNIAGQSQLPADDPLAALSSIAEAVTRTVNETAAGVVQHDLHGYTPGTLMLSGKSLSQRLAEESDPRALLEDRDGQPSLLKIATIAVNTLTGILGAVLTPEDLCEIAATAADNPLGGLALVARKVFATAPTRSPAPKTREIITQVFDAIGRLVSDNAELVSVDNWAKYRDTVIQHGAYAVAVMSAAGHTPARFVADWFAALARVRPAPAPPQPHDAMPRPHPPVDDRTEAALPPPVAIPAPSIEPPDETSGPAPQPVVPRDPSVVLEERARTGRGLTWLLILSEGAGLLYGGRRTLLLDSATTEYLRAAVQAMLIRLL
ncbi:cutinase family protein [Nocardia wallacei]|uniref:cutinase family protein n=1 Tax=Nocardia wallacei TaxID=480035 RepID=UPI002455070F|nr:cutinase family protein [Nocardia wallacei]